jgi:hypothetical protein
MKSKLIMFIAALVLASFGGFGSAQAQTADETETANIPFAFYAGGQKMPAGNYLVGIDLENQLITLRGDSGQEIFVVGTPTGDAADNPELVFKHSGNTYALMEVKSDETDLTFNTRVPSLAMESSLALPQVEVALTR